MDSHQRRCQHQLRLDAHATKPIRHHAEKERAGADGDRHHAQMLDHGRAIEAIDVTKPGGGPQALQRPGCADADRGQRRNAPEASIPVDRPKARGRARCFAQGAGAPLGHGEQNQQRCQRRQARQHSKQAAPPDGLHNKLGRRSRGDGAQRTQHHQPAVGEGKALRREPEHDGLEPGHQRQGHAKTQQRAADHQAEQTIGQSEDERAGAGQQAAAHFGWSSAHSDRAGRRAATARRRRPGNRRRSGSPRSAALRSSSAVRSPAISALMVRNRYER